MISSTSSFLEIPSSTISNLLKESVVEGSHTRQPVLKKLASHRSEATTDNSLLVGPMGPSDFDPGASAKKIYRFIVGKDKGKPVSLSNEEIEENLRDPFTQLVLKEGHFPQTGNALLDSLKKTAEQSNGFKKLRVFLIAEGGQIPWSETTKRVNRFFRYVFVIKTKGGIGPDVMISTGKNLDSKTGFLQLMSWDPAHRAYNFFQRLHAFWIWSGNSFDSLSAKTRNKGPFSGHINGGPIMKELKLPWQHWHSMSEEIRETSLAPTDPMRSNPYFQSREDAQGFEFLVRAGMSHLNEARIARSLSPSTKNVIDFPQFMRQILIARNVNLTSSAKASGAVKPFGDSLRLPFSFFANLEGLSKAGVDPFVDAITVSGEIYLQSLEKFEFALSSEGVTIKGDTHFAFFVPEVCAEDVDLLGKMIEKEMISPKMAACLLMVDFPNPIYSSRREHLLTYVPDTVKAGKGGIDFDEAFIKNLTGSGKHEAKTSPEAELLEYWHLPDESWKTEMGSRVEKYFKNLQGKCETQEGFNDLVRLAESRRHTFKQTPQFEFDLTFASTNIDLREFPLEMQSNGSVRRV